MALTLAALLGLPSPMQDGKQKPDRKVYMYGELPPDTARFTPAKLDSLKSVLAKCFDKTNADMDDLSFFTTDRNLGWTQYPHAGLPAAGRYFDKAKAIVVKAPYKDNVSLIDHEMRHPLADKNGSHPPAVFGKVCK